MVWGPLYYFLVQFYTILLFKHWGSDKKIRDDTGEPSGENEMTMKVKGNNQQSWHRDMKQSSLEVSCVKQIWFLSRSEWVLFPGMDVT